MEKTEYRIIGVIEKDGEFKDTPYHNYVLIVAIFKGGICRACDCTNYKFKKADVRQVLGVDDVTDVIDRYFVKEYFDRFGRLVGVDYE